MVRQLDLAAQERNRQAQENVQTKLQGGQVVHAPGQDVNLVVLGEVIIPDAAHNTSNGDGEGGQTRKLVQHHQSLI